MILQIAIKEVYHNLTTLRFALMIILLPVLFVANALIYSLGSSGYTTQISAYNEQVKQNRNHIKIEIISKRRQIRVWQN